jgi:hypothetical protein
MDRFVTTLINSFQFNEYDGRHFSMEKAIYHVDVYIKTYITTRIAPYEEVTTLLSALEKYRPVDYYGHIAMIVRDYEHDRSLYHGYLICPYIYHMYKAPYIPAFIGQVYDAMKANHVPADESLLPSRKYIEDEYTIIMGRKPGLNKITTVSLRD